MPSTLAACFAKSAVLVRSGASNTEVTRRILSVTAAAAASPMSDS